MTKTEALHALSLYLADARAEAEREGMGQKVDRAETWATMVQGWADAGEISAETAAAWIKTGPR